MFSCSSIMFVISKLCIAKIHFMHLLSFLKDLTRLRGRKPPCNSDTYQQEKTK